MRILAIIIVLGLIGFGAYTFFSQEATAPVSENTETTTEETALHEGETVVEEKKMAAPAEGTRVFDISGTNFAFSQTEIRVKKGDTVRINFTSESGFHDWVVDEFNVETAKVNTGGATSVEFVADKAGEFEYYCSVGSHRANGMVGKLIVE